MLKDNIPRHEQISDWLRSRIRSGTLKEGDQLPSESELGDYFDVSRVTVRHALQTLENEGLIYRRQGLGSFVDKQEIPQPMVCLTDFSEDMQRAGLEAHSEVICREVVEADATVAEQLNLEPHCSVYRLDRLRLGNSREIAFDITWLPMFYGQLLDGQDLEQKTIYQILEEKYEIPILKGHYHITAANADSYLSGHLNVAEKEALILIERLSKSTGEKAIYFQKRYYRPDKIHYDVELERRDAKDCDYSKGLPLKRFTPVFFDVE